MSLFIYKLKEFANKSNSISKKLVEQLTYDVFASKIYKSTSNATDFFVFDLENDYEFSKIKFLFCDGNKIDSNILKFYINECSKYNFQNVYINGITHSLTKFITIRMGLPCINLQNLLSHWETILDKDFANKKLYLLCNVLKLNDLRDLEELKDYKSSEIVDLIYLKGLDIIHKHYKLIEYEQNSALKEKKEFAQYALELYNSGNSGVEDYIIYILTHSFYLFEFDCNPQVQYNDNDDSIIVEYYLPTMDDIPNYAEKKNKLVPLSETALRKLYDSIIYKIVIRTIAEIFHFDTHKRINTIYFNGQIKSKNKATGKDVDNCILSIQINREQFEQIDLDAIDAKVCFKYFKGISASKICDITPITPILTINKNDRRFIEPHNVEVNEGTNLAAIDWEDFEHLVRAIFDMEFNVNGGEVKITQSSRDGGVDAIAFDPDPIRGGKIVIQAKRYTNTVGVSAVRDLYGTIINEGANKGILITTSDYGSDSYKFAMGKPITLLNGGHLLYLMQKHGQKAYINITEAKKINEGKIKIN